MNKENKLETLRNNLEKFYQHRTDLLFHGWHHIVFVTEKSVQFAATEKSDTLIVEAAALTHDLNYAVKINSDAKAGSRLRSDFLTDSGFSPEEIARIENIVDEAHTATRSRIISPEGRSLSDADTLFKVLPLTPILFSAKYIRENKIDIARLADKILTEQRKLLKTGIYFYTKAGKKYLAWAKHNLQLWEYVQEALKDNDVKVLLEMCETMKITDK